MTGLHRTALTTPQKVECAASALAQQQEHGIKTQLSQAYGISRPTVYAAGATAQEVLKNHFEPSSSAHCLACVPVDEAQLQRAIVALRVMAPNALRPIEDMIPILYPGVRLSYGKVQGILVQAERNAHLLNRQTELSGIGCAALDELFSQGDPVLSGVDLDSGYLFALSLRERRSAEDWAEVLDQGKQQGLGLSVVVKDAALGIEAGVKQVFPLAEQRDDCFHVLYEMNKVRRRLEQSAYKAIRREEELQAQLQRIRAKQRKRRRRQQHKIAWARRRCQQAIERYDDFEAALRQVQEALECVDLDSGHLRCGEEVKMMFEQAAQTIAIIDDARCRKVARYLQNRAPGLSLATADLNLRMAELYAMYPAQAVVLACMIWRLVDELQTDRSPWQRTEHSRQLLGAFAQLRAMIKSQTDGLLEAVKQRLDKRHRASSAIEGFNAALRPYLYIHKGCTQGFLELFRAYYNLRTRRWGPRKGSSAHQCLTGQPVGDWLTTLGFAASNTVH
jgi:hypothetical protein